MKLLVLGAGSQVGLELDALLRARGIPFEALDNSGTDLLKQMDLVKAITRIEPDQVINVTSYSSLEKAEIDPAAARECDRVNIEGVATLAEVCDHLGIPLLHHSSSYVFDGHKRQPYVEEDETNPQCRYGLSKWYGERAIRETLSRHVILRTDWVFSVHRHGFLRRCIDACKQGEGRLETMDHRFSPTPAEDVARVFLAIAQQLSCGAEAWGTYHYCALQPLSEAQFVEAFLREAARFDAELARYSDHLEVTVQPPRKPFIANSSLNCQKIMETFGIKQRSRMATVLQVLERLYTRPPLPPAPAAPVEKPAGPAAAGRKPGGGALKRRNPPPRTNTAAGKKA